MSPRFHLFVSDVNQGNEEIELKMSELKIFLRDPRDGKILLRSSASCCEIENVLWEWEVGVWGLLLGGSNVEKWGDHQKKNFFINNSIEAVISFKEKHH